MSEPDDGDRDPDTSNHPTVASLRGAAGKLHRPMMWHEMRDIAREDHVREWFIQKRGLEEYERPVQSRVLQDERDPHPD